MFIDNGKMFYYNYDLDATTYKYGRIGGPGGFPAPSKYGAKTSGSSTTVTAAAGTPFDPANVGDILCFFIPPDTRAIRKVATKVSGASITVDTAIDLGTVGVPFDLYPFHIGATINDGWHSVQMYSAITLWVSVNTLVSAGGLDISIEGNGNSLLGPAGAVTLLAKNYAAAGTESINIGEIVGSIRVGVKGGSGFAGTDIFSIWVTGEMRAR